MKSDELERDDLVYLLSLAHPEYVPQNRTKLELEKLLAGLVYYD